MLFFQPISLLTLIESVWAPRVSVHWVHAVGPLNQEIVSVLPILCVMLWVMVQRWRGQVERGCPQNLGAKTRTASASLASTPDGGLGFKSRVANQLEDHFSRRVWRPAYQNQSPGNWKGQGKKISRDGETKSWHDKPLVSLAVVSRATIHCLNEDVPMGPPFLVHPWNEPLS